MVESNVEKRVRVPITSWESWDIVTRAAGAVALGVFIIRCPWRHSPVRAEELAVPASLLFWSLCRWLWLVARRLKITDSGFAVCWGPWTYYQTDWSKVTKVETRFRRMLLLFGKRYEEMILRTQDAFYVVLPGESSARAAVLSTLTQHLPASVFEER